MKKFFFLIIVHILINSLLLAQKNERTFIFGNSLINHEFQVIPTPSQETSMPYWFQELAESRGYNYAVSGQYGFLPQHANLPPIAQWGFDNVEGAWESDYEPFSEANFTSILITPGNFIQFQSPLENYPYENVSPLSTTLEIFEWCEEQEPNVNFYIYENWPDMAGFLNNNFPPSDSEWQTYNDYLNGEFHDWFVEYIELVRSNFGEPCVRFIPVGTAISHLLQKEPFDQIPITELYEDDAPHGRATTYFLSSLVTYMVMYEEKVLPSVSFEVDEIIHPIIQDNYLETIDVLWDFLVDNFELIYTREEGCELLTKTQDFNVELDGLSVFPNPVEDVLHIAANNNVNFYKLYCMKGIRHHIDIENGKVSLGHLQEGYYMLISFAENGNVIGQQMILKM